MEWFEIFGRALQPRIFVFFLLIGLIDFSQVTSITLNGFFNNWRGLQGRNHTLECIHPNAIKYTWSFTPTNADSPTKYYNGSKVVLTSVARNTHEGTWRCNATDNNGVVHHQKQDLNVFCSNLTTRVFPQSNYILVGESFDVECIAETPTDKMEVWFYNMTDPNGGVGRVRKTVVGDVSTTCNINDGADRRNWTIPENCNASTSTLFVLTTRSVQTENGGQWRCYQPSTDCGSHLQIIKLLGKCNSTQEANAACNVNAMCTTQTMHTKYPPIISCKCKPGYRKHFIPGINQFNVNCTLIDPPMIISAIKVSVNSTTVIVTWEKVTQGNFDKYIAAIYPYSRSAYHLHRQVTVPASTAAPRAVFPNLQPDLTYRIYVYTSNVKGGGPMKYSRVYIPISPLYFLGFIPTAPHKAKVYWSGNCKVAGSGYNITWGPQTNGTTIDKTTIPCTGSAYEVNLSGLRLRTNYTVWVATTNLDQSVLTKAIVVNIGDPDVRITVSSRRYQAAIVSWARNCTGSGNYNIALSPKAKIDKTTIPCNSNKTEVTLSGLKTSTSYTISITTVVWGQSDVTKTKTFKISGGVRIQGYPKWGLDTTQGENHTIECKCSSFCTKMRINGFSFIPFSSTSPSKFYNDTKMNFPSLDRKKHEGTWRCNATGSDGVVYTTDYILFLSCTNLNITINTLSSLVAGDSYSVECNVASASDKVELWYYDSLSNVAPNRHLSQLVVGDVSTKCNIYDGFNRRNWTYPGDCYALTSRLFVLKNTAVQTDYGSMWRCYQPSTGCVSSGQRISVYGKCNTTELANTTCSANATCVKSRMQMATCICKHGYHQEWKSSGRNNITCIIFEPPWIQSEISITVNSTTATANVTWAKPPQGMFEKYNVTVSPNPNTTGEQARTVIVQASVAYPFAVFTMLTPDTVYMAYIQTMSRNETVSQKRYGQPNRHDRRQFFVPRNRTTMTGWPTNSTAIVGASVSWTCKPATAGTYNYTWYRGTTVISTKQTFTTVIAAAHGGSYRCDAKDSVGKISSSLTRTLTVSSAPTTPNYAPPAAELPNLLRGALQGSKFSLKCKNNGASYRWFFTSPSGNTTSLTSKTQEMLFDPVDRVKHEGIYQCLATSTTGSVQVAIMILYVYCDGIKLSTSTQTPTTGAGFELRCDISSPGSTVGMVLYRPSFNNSILNPPVEQGNVTTGGKCNVIRTVPAEQSWSDPTTCLASSATKEYKFQTKVTRSTDTGFWRCEMKGCASPPVGVLVYGPCTTAVEKAKCHSQAICLKNGNTIKCVCKPGYFGNGTICAGNDCDAAKRQSYGCSVNSYCSTTGNPNCACKQGFTGDGKSCKLNDCDANTRKNYGCSEHAFCRKSASPNCVCKPGYSGDGKTCKFNNDCDDSQRRFNGCSVNADCSISATTNCQCKQGYSGDGKQCTDVNECSDPKTMKKYAVKCHILAVCENTVGGYKCKCKPGTLGDGTVRCDTICTDAQHKESKCSTYAICTKTDGKYSCKCKEGFTGNGFTCTAIDDCNVDERKKNSCSIDAYCFKLKGVCTCKPGFYGDGKTCTTVKCTDKQRNDNKCDDHADCSISYGKPECTCKTGYRGDGKTCIPGLFYPIGTVHYRSTSFTSWSFGYRWGYWWIYKWYMYPRCHYLHSGEIIPLGCDTFRIICVHYNGLVTLHNNWREIWMLFQCLHNLNDWFQNGCEDKPNSLDCARQRCGNAAFIGGYILRSAYCPEKTDCITFNAHIRNPRTSWPWYKRYGRTKPSVDSKVVFNKVDADIRAFDAAYSSYKSEMVFVITLDNMIPFDTPKSGEHYSAQLAIATDGERTFLINLYADFKMSQTPPKARGLPIINSYSAQLPYTTKECHQIDKANIGNADKRFSMDKVIGNTGDKGKHIIVVPPLGDILKKRCFGALKSLNRSIAEANVPNTCPFNYVHMRWYAIRVKGAYTQYKRFPTRKGQKRWEYTMCFGQTWWSWWWGTTPYTKSKQPEVCCYRRNEEPKPWQWWREWLREKREDGLSRGEIRQEYIMLRDSPIALVTHGRDAGYAYSPEDSKIAEDAWKYCCHDADLCHYFHQYLPVSGADNYEPPDEVEIKGDPHYITLDGQSYTFNGHGEYTLVKGSSPENIILQARTAPPKSKGSTPSKATVFTGFCMAASNADKVEVSLDSTGKLRILLNKTVEVAYSSLNTNGTIYKGVTISLQENVTDPTVIVNYDAGFTVTVKLNENLGYLINSVYVDKKFKTKLEGLLGNYDGNKENDLKCANGTVIASNSSDSLIFDCFQTWQVKSEAESCFSYASVPFEKRSNISFFPIFVDEYKDNMLTLFNNNNTFYNAANKTCSSHSQENLYLACMYDASQLQTIAAAEVDVNGYKETKKKTDIKINKRPVINMPSHIRVSTNKTLVIIIKVSDPENDTLTSMLNVTGYGATVTLTERTTLSILAMNASQFKFVASFKDSKMAVSKWEPEVHLCDVVIANGVCDYAEVESVDKDTNDLDHYVAGVNCTDDCGGSRCEEGPCSGTNNPCPKGTKCTAKGCKAECGPCPSGSERSGKICIDIDECEKTSPCQHNCNNTPEFSYTCWCNDGSQLDPTDNNKCIDFNECDYKAHNCSAAKNEVCENTVGSFKCVCAKGYTTGSNGCQDINECTASKHNCAPDATCTNTIGGFNCTCKQGYFGNGTSCKDLNECSVSNKCQHECKNTVGSYTCACKTGYDLAADGHSCTVSISSKCGANNCKHTCIKKSGVDTCECNKGWVLSTVDKVSCLDEDECSTGNHKCSQKCVNEPGGHNCTCNTGYKLEDDGFSCSDLNECSVSNKCQHECTITVGSYTCACKTGYALADDGHSCTAKSYPNWECKAYDGRGAKCFCSAGYALDDAFNCRKATQRYRWQIAVDVTYDPDLDNPSSKAHNTFGDLYASEATSAVKKTFPKTKCSASYIKYGKGSTIVYMNLDIYSPDSLTAAGLQPDYAAVTAMLTALVQKSGSTCYIAGVGAVVCDSSLVGDANECTDGQHQCTSTMYCVNTPGEYECKCLPGFVDRQTGTSKIAPKCEDVNECTTTCKKANSVCTNTVGSFICKCKDGYWSSSPVTTDCTDPCSPNPCENKGTCAFSAEIATGYKCTCEPGFTGTQCDVKVTAVDGGSEGGKSPESKLTLYAIIGGVAGVVVIIAVAVGIYCGLKKKNAKQSGYRSSTPVNSFSQWPDSRRTSAESSERRGSVNRIQPA